MFAALQANLEEEVGLPEPGIPLEPGLPAHYTWAPPCPPGPRAGGCREAGLQPPGLITFWKFWQRHSQNYLI